MIKQIVAVAALLFVFLVAGVGLALVAQHFQPVSRTIIKTVVREKVIQKAPAPTPTPTPSPTTTVSTAVHVNAFSGGSVHVQAYRPRADCSCSQ